MRIPNIFSLAYLALGAAILAIELAGAFGGARNDTISEHYWYVQERFPLGARIVLTIFLGWLWLHLVWRKW